MIIPKVRLNVGLGFYHPYHNEFWRITSNLGFIKFLGGTELTISELNWIGDQELSEVGINCIVKLRSQIPPIHAQVYPISPTRAKVVLSEPYHAITPGQACVMYNDTRMLGGGWRSKVVLLSLFLII